jgi:hypothetical protein
MSWPCGRTIGLAPPRTVGREAARGGKAVHGLAQTERPAAGWLSSSLACSARGRFGPREPSLTATPPDASDLDSLQAGDIPPSDATRMQRRCNPNARKRQRPCNAKHSRSPTDPSRTVLLGGCLFEVGEDETLPGRVGNFCGFAGPSSRVQSWCPAAGPSGGRLVGVGPKGRRSPRPPRAWPVEGGLARPLLGMQPCFMGLHSIGGIRWRTLSWCKALLGKHLRYLMRCRIEGRQPIPLAVLAVLAAGVHRSPTARHGDL